MKITGTQINYYFHCKRHLWLFANSMNMEHTSDWVAYGRFISEDTYKKSKHELEIVTENEYIVLDYFDRRNKVIHEIKKSDKLEDINIWQLKFYIFVLERSGTTGVKGVLDYPKLKKKVNVELTEDDRRILNEAEAEIKTIVSGKAVPVSVKMKFCRKCSYFDLCYI